MMDLKMTKNKITAPQHAALAKATAHPTGRVSSNTSAIVRDKLVALGLAKYDRVVEVINGATHDYPVVVITDAGRAAVAK